jgi:hypothetical protein
MPDLGCVLPLPSCCSLGALPGGSNLGTRGMFRSSGKGQKRTMARTCGELDPGEGERGWTAFKRGAGDRWGEQKAGGFGDGE